MDLEEAYNRLNEEAGLARESEEMLLTRAHYRDEDYTDDENEERKLLAYLQRKRWKAAEAIENSDATSGELEEAYGTLEDWYNNLRIHGSLGYISPIKYRESNAIKLGQAS